MKKRISEYLPHLAVGVLFVSMLFPQSCANTTQAPSGGKKDTLAPVITKMSPANGSVRVPQEGVTFVFTFNEYVKIKDAKGIQLSPPQSKAPKAKIKGKSVEVTFEEPFQPNTTYSLSFYDAIADNNEGNVFPGMSYAFSTGEFIDSMMVTGTVQDCSTLKPVKGATVLFYKDFADSAVFNSSPDLAFRTDDWGFFCARNLSPEGYRVYAIEDKNSNLRYDPGEELVAFLDSVFTASTVMNDSIPELGNYNMKDTLLCLGRKSELRMNLFKEDISKQMIINSGRTSRSSAFVKFSARFAHIDSLWIMGVEPERLISQFNDERDSLLLWINDGGKYKLSDTLQLYVNYRKTDSLGNRIPFLENVKLYGSTKVDTTCKFTLTAVPETVEQDGWVFSFEQPIVYEHFDSLTCVSVNPKQAESPAAFEVKQDSSDVRKFIFRLKEEMQLGYEYKVKVPAGCFLDITGAYSDSLETKVSLPTDEKLSSLHIVLSGVDRKYIIELMSEKKDRVMRKYIINSDCTLDFPYLAAANYVLRMTEDINENNVVDSGILLEHKQPEKVLFYSSKDNELINIPESSDINQNINLAELFK